MAGDAQLTPMMAQYRRIKSELPKDALLLFRLGDFYELFFEDAQIGAQLLNVALTKRGVIPIAATDRLHARAAPSSRPQETQQLNHRVRFADPGIRSGN